MVFGPNLSSCLFLYSLNTENDFYLLQCLYTKWLYKCLYNILSFVSWLMKSNILTLWVKKMFPNPWS